MSKQRFQLDRIISVEHYTTTRDSFGQERKVWATLVDSAYAGVVYQQTGGDEDIKGKQLLSQQQLEFQTRNIISNPNAKMRIIFEGFTYNVLYVRPIDRRMGFVWRCELRDNTDGTVL